MGKAARLANREMRREQALEAGSEMTEAEVDEFIARRYDERRASGRGNRCSDETRLRLANWMVDREEAGVAVGAEFYAQAEQVAVVERVRAERVRSSGEEDVLALMAEIRRLESRLDEAVALKRAAGVSWQEIATELGIERMAAVRKYNKGLR